MGPELQLALIGVGGAVIGAIVTGFIQPLVSELLAKKTRLRVEVLPASFRMPRFLAAAIKEYRHNYKLNIRPTKDVSEHLGATANFYAMHVVRITNKSKRSIDEVVLALSDKSDFAADLSIDGTDRDTYFGRLCSIGSLRPNAVANVTVWSTSNDADNKWTASNSIVVSAREFDRFGMQVNVPPYVDQRYILISRRFLWRSFWLFLALWWFLIIAGQPILSLFSK